MATTTDNTTCHICGEHVETYKCTKCDRVFCFPHLQAHREETLRELQDVQNNLNLTQERVNRMKEKLTDHPCMQTIGLWERDSIIKIQQAARDARRAIEERLTIHMRSMKSELEELTTTVRQTAEKNKFDETHVNQWNRRLNLVKDRIDQPSNITIIEGDKPLVNLLDVQVLIPISRK